MVVMAAQSSIIYRLGLCILFKVALLTHVFYVFKICMNSQAFYVA